MESKLGSFFVGKENWIKEKKYSEKLEKASKNKIRELFKKYLLLDNVNFFFGTGSSLHLGAESIQGIPEKILKDIRESETSYLFEKLVTLYTKKDCKKLEEKLNEKKDFCIWENKLDMLEEKSALKQRLKTLVEEDKKINLLKAYKLGGLSEKDKKIIIKLGVEIKLEDFLNYLYAIRYLMLNSEDVLKQILTSEEKEENKVQDRKHLEELIEVIKKSLFEMCDLDNISSKDNKFLKNTKDNKVKENIKENGKYIYHKRFLQALLQRPVNLRRANIFTINYDLAFEYACDELGVQYINGFAGFNERNFRPEVYNYDFFYPGDTTEGKVRRIERVIKYYKLHGSLNWVYKEKNKHNPYGLYEVPIDLVRMQLEDEEKRKKLGEIMIYPTSSKKEYTLNFPYSELFRKFADRLQQPESVLFVIGYSFYDEHINDIIYQALANPSFTLIIVDFNGSKNGGEIKRLKDLEDPRIIISEGNQLGDFKVFATELLPYLEKEDTREKVIKTLNELFKSEENEGVE